MLLLLPLLPLLLLPLLKEITCSTPLAYAIAAMFPSGLNFTFCMTCDVTIVRPVCASVLLIDCGEITARNRNRPSSVEETEEFFFSSSSLSPSFFFLVFFSTYVLAKQYTLPVFAPNATTLSLQSMHVNRTLGPHTSEMSLDVE